MSDATTTSKGANAPMMAAYLMLVACAMMWGSNHVVVRGVNATVPLEALAFWRWVVAAVLLFPVCIPHLKRDLRLMADHKMPMFLIGTTGVFMFSIVIYLAAYYTTAVNTGILNATTPVWVLLFAAVLRADKPRLGQWVGVLIAGVGTAVIIAKGDFSVFAEMNFVSGDLLLPGMKKYWGSFSAMNPRSRSSTCCSMNVMPPMSSCA